jgi:hypothetical protein
MEMKELSLTFRGIFSLFWPLLSMRPFVDNDYDAEIAGNKALAKKSEAEIEKRRKEYEPEVEKRMRSFRWVVWSSFLFLLSAITVAKTTTALLRPASPSAKIFLGGASIFSFAWSTLARLGRSGTSMGGNTALERVDLRVLWILYWIGTLLGTLAII